MFFGGDFRETNVDLLLEPEDLAPKNQHQQQQKQQQQQQQQQEDIDSEFHPARLLKTDPLALKVQLHSRRDLQPQSDGSVVDVLVLWTVIAECRNSGLGNNCQTTAATQANLEALVLLAFEETNLVMKNSQIGTEYYFTHGQRVDSFFLFRLAPSEHQFRSRTDKFLPVDSLLLHTRDAITIVKRMTRVAITVK